MKIALIHGIWDGDHRHPFAKRATIALTRVELAVLICIVVIGAGLLLPLLARPRSEGRRSVCAESLRQIGKAIAYYREANMDYFPFSWGPADVPEPRRKDVLASLGCLYPDYMEPQTFRCPSTENNPSFELHVAESQAGRESKAQNENWVLLDSSYGYDCRVSPRISGDSPIAADMDGTGDLSRDTSMRNHVGGQNVLFSDGSVKWLDMARVWSFGPAQEDIFVENPWHADTDAFISSNNAFGGKSWLPAGPDDLGPSYDPYPSLHPKSYTVASGDE